MYFEKRFNFQMEKFYLVKTFNKNNILKLLKCYF